MQTQDFLLEIGTEELPAVLLPTLIQSLAQGIAQSLTKAELKYDNLKYYATPRRLAVLIKQLQAQQADRIVERKGPALKAAYDDQQQPTPALVGFLRSCNTTADQLIQTETQQGVWLFYRYQEIGKSVFDLLPDIVNKALLALPIPKPMKWGEGNNSFIRPIHWIVLLYGKEIIPGKFFDLPTQQQTYGHRFHHPDAINIPEPAAYEKLLSTQGFVMADFAQRQQLIQQQTISLATEIHGQAVFNEDLLQEVTGLVEWPIALLAKFDKEFLTVPYEALIAAMEHHQKSFAIKDQNNKLLPYFVTISNINSLDPNEVIRGNERVMRARLSDAKFFYEIDCKQTLNSRLENLKTIIFQTKLGSLYDKSQRLAALASLIGKSLQCEPFSTKAGLLCKADLNTQMVQEFPDLQGIMGYYYALNDSEPLEVANAIKEHYLPRFAGDKLPASMPGCAVSLADRLDTLVGIFGINQQPTGEKDPFGLRRAAVAILRILIERELNLNLSDLIKQAHKNYLISLPNAEVNTQVQEYILERLRTWYQDQNIAADTLASVLAVQNENLLDLDRRVRAVQIFRDLPEAQALAAANKRVKNLLKQADLLNNSNSNLLEQINPALFEHAAEKELFAKIVEKEQSHISSYPEHLKDLASLQPAVDQFFDKVLVMEENPQIKNNRLILLAALRKLFLAVADISFLQL